MSMGPQPALGRRPLRPLPRPPLPSRRMRSAKVTSRMALAAATPMAMIAPMNDWMFSVVPVSQQGQGDAGEHRRHRRNADNGQPHRLEIGGQQQEDDDHRQDQADRHPLLPAAAGQQRRTSAAWAAPGRGHRRWRRGAGRRPAGSPHRCGPSPGPGPLPRCWRSCSPAASCCSGRTPQAASARWTRATSRSNSVLLGPVPLTGTMPIVSRRIHLIGRHLHLHLVADAAFRVGPEDRHHEAARRGGRHQRAGHVGRRHAALAGPLAVQLHGHGRIVERLHELQVAQARGSRANSA